MYAEERWNEAVISWWMQEYVASQVYVLQSVICCSAWFMLVKFHLCSGISSALFLFCCLAHAAAGIEVGVYAMANPLYEKITVPFAVRLLCPPGMYARCSILLLPSPQRIELYRHWKPSGCPSKRPFRNRKRILYCFCWWKLVETLQQSWCIHEQKSFYVTPHLSVPF